MKISKQEYARLKQIEDVAALYFKQSHAGHDISLALCKALEPLEPKFIEGHLYWYYHDSWHYKVKKNYNHDDENDFKITHLTDQDWRDIGAPVGKK